MTATRTRRSTRKPAEQVVETPAQDLTPEAPAEAAEQAPAEVYVATIPMPEAPAEVTEAPAAEPQTPLQAAEAIDDPTEGGKYQVFQVGEKFNRRAAADLESLMTFVRDDVPPTTLQLVEFWDWNVKRELSATGGSKVSLTWRRRRCLHIRTITEKLAERGIHLDMPAQVKALLPTPKPAPAEVDVEITEAPAAEAEIALAS